jgi:hypothetical protein
MASQVGQGKAGLVPGLVMIFFVEKWCVLCCEYVMFCVLYACCVQGCSGAYVLPSSTLNYFCSAMTYVCGFKNLDCCCS